jgi:hypothetical protein
MKETTKESTLEDEALYGMKVEILEEAAPEWYLVKTHYRYCGYVHSSELLFDEDKLENWEKAQKAVVNHFYADVLSMPKVQGYHLISLTRGGLVAVLSPADENGWVKVGLCDGRIGYMKEKFLGEYIPAGT